MDCNYLKIKYYKLTLNNILILIQNFKHLSDRLDVWRKFNCYNQNLIFFVRNFIFIILILITHRNLIAKLALKDHCGAAESLKKRPRCRRAPRGAICSPKRVASIGVVVRRSGRSGADGRMGSFPKRAHRLTHTQGGGFLDDARARMQLGWRHVSSRRWHATRLTPARALFSFRCRVYSRGRGAVKNGPAFGKNTLNIRNSGLLHLEWTYLVQPAHNKTI